MRPLYGPDAARHDVLAQGAEPALPTDNHAVVLVFDAGPPTMAALGYAKVTRPTRLTALTVNLRDTDTWALQAEWDRRDISIPLTIIESRGRGITRPIVDYVQRIREQAPHDVVTVVIPEYIVGHWWEQLLHNQSALRLKSRLLFQPNVMVTNVPYHLRTSPPRQGNHPHTSDINRLEQPPTAPPTAVSAGIAAQPLPPIAGWALALFP